MRLVALALLLAAVFAVPAAADTLVTSDQAAAVANAINLTSADLPGWDGVPDSGGGLISGDPGVDRCVGAVAQLKPIVDISSPGFMQADDAGLMLAESDVSVMQSAADAQRTVALLASKRAQRCLAKAIRKEQDKHFKITRLSFKKLTPPVPGGVGLRIAMRFKADGFKLPMTIDVLGFVRGNVATTLIGLGTPARFPGNLERHLANLLVTRAQQQLP